MQTLVIDAGPIYNRVAVFRDGALDDLQLEPSGNPSLVGHIFKGRVERVEPGLDAAFVDIGLGKSGYLGIRDILPPEKRPDARIQDHIRGGQELLVQVIKDVREEKGVQLTTRITLPGKYLVLTPEEPVISLSNKIAGSLRRKALGAAIASLMPENMGAVVRTDAATAEPEAIAAELNRLLALWHRIARYRVLGAAPMLVFKEATLGLRLVRRLKNVEIDRICSNSRLQTAEVLDYLTQKQQAAPVVQETVDTEMLDQTVREALNPFVPLPGGGSLWIEATRAMTVIDVNSGGQIGRGDAQSTFLRVNLAAALEIGRQLRIRNITGMIVVDFIDMKSPDHRRTVSQALTEATAADRMPVSVLGYTKLGLLEMTRKAEHPPLRDLLTVPCEACEATGRLEASGLRLEQLDLELNRLATHTLVKKLVLEADEALFRALQSGALGGLASLGSRYGLEISVQACSGLIGYKIIKG